MGMQTRLTVEVRIVAHSTRLIGHSVQRCIRDFVIGLIGIAEVGLCIPLTPAATDIEIGAPQRVAIEMDLQGFDRLAADEVHRRTEGITTEKQ